MTKPNDFGISFEPYIFKGPMTISPYTVTYWDQEKKDREYIICSSEADAQEEFLRILLGGNTNVEILQAVQSIHFRRYKNGQLLDGEDD